MRVQNVYEYSRLLLRHVAFAVVNKFGFRRLSPVVFAFFCFGIQKRQLVRCFHEFSRVPMKSSGCVQLRVFVTLKMAAAAFQFPVVCAQKSPQTVGSHDPIAENCMTQDALRKVNLPFFG
jgi:hypothetical protein